ncbi:hypothetical protein TL16_g11643 [Triparma laevis f. inornata]|uniref:Uncharacterized protein n=1 Tax=Triparma laevis f. inornata TaxID=1714386 RepID=A0A9W7BK89_9STRA|nr:hypothetical protein TL16_g11643 [Triparma laevis f. inornata]
MRFSTLALLSSFTVGVAAQSKSCGTFNNMLVADMGDGDQKYVTLVDDQLTLGQPGIWNLTTTVDFDTCVATVDFSKSDKPEQPPCPLNAQILQTGVGTIILEYTDSTGTINTDSTYPLNLWTSTEPLPNVESCLVFEQTKFQDMHDGDVKNVELTAGGQLTMGQEGIWSLTTQVDPITCQATIDFSQSTKPDQPPVPLIATVVKASGETASDLNQRMMLVFTDPSGELNEDSEYPLNIWEAV